jgi:hypothetical protein
MRKLLALGIGLGDFLTPSFVKIIRIQHNSMANLVQEVSVCIFLDLGFNFHLEFPQYKFTEDCRNSFQPKMAYIGGKKAEG